MIHKLLSLFKRKPVYRYRDAGTGRYVKEAYALDNPLTTVRERVG
jgi:hypothetical protein